MRRLEAYTGMACTSRMMATQSLPIRRASHTLAGGRSLSSSSVNSFCSLRATLPSSVTSWATQGYSFRGRAESTDRGP